MRSFFLSVGIIDPSIDRRKDKRKEGRRIRNFWKKDGKKVWRFPTVHGAIASILLTSIQSLPLKFPRYLEKTRPFLTFLSPEKRRKKGKKRYVTNLFETRLIRRLLFSFLSSRIANLRSKAHLRRRVELEAFAQIYTGPMTQMATSNGKETLEREREGGGGKERIAEIAR